MQRIDFRRHKPPKCLVVDAEHFADLRFAHRLCEECALALGIFRVDPCSQFCFRLVLRVERCSPGIVFRVGHCLLDGHASRAFSLFMSARLLGSIEHLLSLFASVGSLLFTFHASRAAFLYSVRPSASVTDSSPRDSASAEARFTRKSFVRGRLFPGQHQLVEFIEHATSPFCRAHQRERGRAPSRPRRERREWPREEPRRDRSARVCTPRSPAIPRGPRGQRELSAGPRSRPPSERRVRPHPLPRPPPRPAAALARSTGH
jgi:hypothetical protein